MAIRKQIELDNGAVAEYFRIREIEYRGNIDFPTTELRVTVAVYIDEAARRGGKSWADVKNHPIPIANVTPDKVDFSNFQRMGYLLLKTLPEYSGCEDC